MDLETSTSSSPPATEFSTTRSRRRHPPHGGVRRRSSRTTTEIGKPNKRSRMRLQGTAAAAAKLDIRESASHMPPPASSAHADMQRAALGAGRELGPASSSSTLSHNNAGGDSVSVSVEGKNDGVLVGDDGGGGAEFVDEEAIFNMPLLVDCMAEGMLLTPPSMKKGFSWSEDDDDGIVEFNLWQQ